MPPNRLTLALLCSPRTRSPTLTLGHRCALSGPARSASGLSALFPRRERPTHVTRDKFSVWGGVFKSFAGDGAPGRCTSQRAGYPIRSAQSRSPHSRVRDGHGAYRLCCGLACGDDARAPRHRASGPRRPLPARARPPPRAGIFRAIALFAALGPSLVESRATRTGTPTKATGQNADAHGGPAQNPQNSRHRAETKRSTRAKRPPRVPLAPCAPSSKPVRHVPVRLSDTPLLHNDPYETAQANGYQPWPPQLHSKAGARAVYELFSSSLYI